MPYLLTISLIEIPRYGPVGHRVGSIRNVGSVPVPWSNDGFVVGAEPVMASGYFFLYKYMLLPTPNVKEILIYCLRCASVKW